MDDSYNSYSRKQLDDLFLKMIAYYGGDPKRIQHFVKVHSFARIIAIGEQMDEGSLFILEAAAYTHDIGIKPAEEKYGQCDGKLQGNITAVRFDSIKEDILQHIAAMLFIQNPLIPAFA